MNHVESDMILACVLGTSERMSESWNSFMAEDRSTHMTERWDWHAWQFFVALLPAFGSLLISIIRRWNEYYCGDLVHVVTPHC